MSKIALSGNASGTGTLTIAAPNTSTDRTLTLPDESGTVLTSGGAIDVNASAPADSVVINSSGNVGVGTTSPSTRLHVFSTGSVGIQSQTSSAGAGFFQAKNSSGSSYLGQDSTGGYLLTDYSAPFLFYTNNTERARITSGGYFKASNNGTYDGVANAYHEFRTTSSATETLVISNTSASPYGVFVSFSNDPNNATNTVFSAYTGATAIYRIFSNGTVSARSDAKWKKNIETARDGYVDDLARLRVVKYNWYNHEDGTPKELGLIAQEVEEVFPGLVQTDEETTKEVRTREIPAVLDEDGNEVEPARTEEYTEQVGTGEYTKSIKFSVFTPMLIKAVQELKAITDTQAQTISALEARIAALETQE